MRIVGKDTPLKAIEIDKYVRAKELVHAARTQRSQQKSMRSAVNFREADIRNAKLLNYAAGDPHYRIRKAALASKASLVLGALFASAILSQTFLLYRLGLLVSEYGVDHLPIAAMLDGLRISMTAVLIAQFVWCCGTLACLMYSFYEVYILLKTSRRAKLRYDLRWTAGSLFIPVAFLYRPWLGLAELRRKAIEPEPDAATIFDPHAFSLGLSFFGLIVTGVVINGAISRLLAHADGVNADAIRVMTQLLLLEAGAVAAVTAFCYYYSRSAIMGMRRALLRRG